MGIFWRKKQDATVVDEESKPVPGGADINHDVLEQARVLIRPGFRTFDDAREALEYFFEDSEPEVTAAEFDAGMRLAWGERLSELEGLPEGGDYSKVAAAFADLESKGFIARMNFTCCNTCGNDEIEDERTSPEQNAFVFFHQQDADRLLGESASLFLSFGFLEGHPQIDSELLAVAHSGDKLAQSAMVDVFKAIESGVGAEVVQTLRGHGLEVEWNGSSETRPRVSVGQWNKPLPN